MRGSWLTGSVLLSLGLWAPGCEPMEQCRYLPLQQVDEAQGCLRGPMAAGARACLAPDQLPGKGLFPICLMDEDGRLFRAWVGSNERLEGAGWTHSELPRAPSTLSPDAEQRCAQAPPATLDFASACH